MVEYANPESVSFDVLISGLEVCDLLVEETIRSRLALVRVQQGILLCEAAKGVDGQE